MRRKDRARIAQETLHILESHRYRAPSGRVVGISLSGSSLYTPSELAARAPVGDRATDVEVFNETTLVGSRALYERHGRVVALNFASAGRPGGGWLRGAHAQEESLARASGLYSTLFGSPYYAFHYEQRDPHYSDHIIYSPDVPVFRTDDGALIEEPWPCSFITSPAVNLSRFDGRDESHVGTVMLARIRSILDVAAAHGHREIVLGAFGCGVFLNDPVAVAGHFAQALHQTHEGVFDHVRFSVLDVEGGANIEAFVGAFGTALET